MPAQKPLVSVIILTTGFPEVLAQCLASLSKAKNGSPFEVIVVDNGSFTAKSIAAPHAFVSKVIENPDNKGFAFAVNQGFMAGHGKYFFLLNDDCLVLNHWLDSSVAVMAGHAGIAAVGSRLCADALDHATDTGVCERLDVCGGAMLLSRKALERVGLFDFMNFSPIYAEETDWCLRAGRQGYKIFRNDDSRIIHLKSFTVRRLFSDRERRLLLISHGFRCFLMNLHSLGVLKKFLRLALEEGSYSFIALPEALRKPTQLFRGWLFRLAGRAPVTFKSFGPAHVGRPGS